MYRLIYKSRSSGPVSRETVSRIIHSSMEMNRKHGVRGALLATATHFLQVLEGEYEALNETFFRILKDPGHHDIRIVHFAPAGRHLFQDWAMRGFGVFDLNRNLEERLREKYGEEDGGVRFPEEEWSALSMVFDVSMMDEPAIS
ncbi:MAG: hypothetical protein AVO35_05570 [Candidatus Aegiribacteria sp. MLS_C]|nr:MAG: hypothetical protein AVO35_05570 [Candidatus Aegiribacteria sp. MLS_C]